MGGGKVEKLMVYQWPEPEEGDREAVTPEQLMAKVRALKG